MPCHAHPCPCAHVPMCPCAHARLVPPVTQTRPPLLRPQLAPRTRADCTRVWRWVLLGVVVCWSDVSCDASCGYHSWPEASSPFAALGVAIAPPCGVTCGGASLRRAGTWNPEHRASIVVRRSSFVVRGSWVTSSSPHHHHHLIITSSSPPHGPEGTCTIPCARRCPNRRSRRPTPPRTRSPTPCSTRSTLR